MIAAVFLLVFGLAIYGERVHDQRACEDALHAERAAAHVAPPTRAEYRALCRGARR